VLQKRNTLVSRQTVSWISAQKQIIAGIGICITVFA
jgi:hypothetical protein